MKEKEEIIPEGVREVEVWARNLLDVNFKYTWTIENYVQLLDDKKNIDSPIFGFNVNGLRTNWSLAIRFWRDEEGRGLTNPVVVCLNLVSSHSEEPEMVEVRFQFGIWNAIVKQYEVSPISIQEVDVTGPERKDELVSLDYSELNILDMHLSGNGNSIEMFCKIMLVRKKFEQNTLALDLWNKKQNRELCDVTLRSSDGDTFPAHKTILACRSPVFCERILKGQDVLHLQMSTDILTCLLQYIYTDRVDPLKTPQGLLKVAENLELPGLKNICEKALVDSINPLNVAEYLLIADTFRCETLKKAGMAYVEENSGSIPRTLPWKIMERVNPALFEEVCQTQG